MKPMPGRHDERRSFERLSSFAVAVWGQWCEGVSPLIFVSTILASLSACTNIKGPLFPLVFSHHGETHIPGALGRDGCPSRPSARTSKPPAPSARWGHHALPPRLMATLTRKLRGHYNYYGVTHNSDSLWEYWHHANRVVCKWLNRRSQ